MNLQQTTYLAGSSLCAYLTSRWRPRSLSSKESRVAYFAITRVCQWVGMCTVNGWQLIHHKFRTKFIPLGQFHFFICSYPERALSVSYLGTLCCHYNGESTIATLWTWMTWKKQAQRGKQWWPCPCRTEDSRSLIKTKVNLIEDWSMEFPPAN